MTNGIFNVSTMISPVRVLANANVVGTYSMGPSNNGVGGSLTLTTTTLTLDNVVIKNGDRVLLTEQSSAGQNGIYVVSNVSGVGGNVLLTRSNDFQCIEQLHGGQTIPVSEGEVFAGTIAVIETPLPQTFGIDEISISIPISYPELGNAAFKNVTDNSQPLVASVDGDFLVGETVRVVDTLGTLSGFKLPLFIENFPLIYQTPTTVLIQSGRCMASDRTTFLSQDSNVKVITLGTSGVGGLDEGAVTPNTSYNVFVIGSTNEANETQFIFSLQFIAPAYPADFSVSRRIGKVLTNDDASAFVWFNQCGPNNTGVRSYNITNTPVLTYTDLNAPINFSVESIIGGFSFGNIRIPMIIQNEIAVPSNSAWNASINTPENPGNLFEMAGSNSLSSTDSQSVILPDVMTGLVTIDSNSVYGLNYTATYASSISILGFTDYL